MKMKNLTVELTPEERDILHSALLVELDRFINGEVKDESKANN